MNLQIKDLTVQVEDKTILKEFSLDIKDGEIHAIMGPNGVGKSTLSKVILGNKNFTLTKGDILFKNESIINLPTYERSRKGIFLAMQNPISIDGVSNQDFLRTAINSVQNKNIGLYEFILKSEEAMKELNMPKDMIHRFVNVGFSGGERKKNEILQMKMLKPKLVILDEIDSGLDVDSLRIVCDNINSYLKDNPNTSVLIITHYPRILEYLKPDYVHVMYDGKIIETSDYTLAFDIEKNGYNSIIARTNRVSEGNTRE